MANALTKVTGNVIDSTTNITAGIITATSFVGSGANLTGVASTDNIRTNTNATFLQSVNVTGIVTTAGVNASGVITATSSIVGSAVTINASGINATGVITATSFSGSGANLTGVASTDNIRTNTNATFLQNINVTGIVTASGANVSGVSTFTTVKVGTAATIDSSGVQVGAGKSIRLYGATSGFSDIIAAAGSASTIFTLPANGGTAGQFLQTDGSGALSFAGAGKILQVVQTVKTDTFTTSSTTPVDITGFNVSITPSSSSSKILVSWLINSSGNGHCDFYLMRGSTKLFFGDLSGNQTQSTHHMYAVSNYNTYFHIDALSGQYLDSPATTSSLTYKFQAAVPFNSTYSVAMNYVQPNQNISYNSRTASSITVMEVAG